MVGVRDFVPRFLAANGPILLIGVIVVYALVHLSATIPAATPSTVARWSQMEVWLVAESS